MCEDSWFCKHRNEYNDSTERWFRLYFVVWLAGYMTMTDLAQSTSRSFKGCTCFWQTCSLASGILMGTRMASLTKQRYQELCIMLVHIFSPYPSPKTRIAVCYEPRKSRFIASYAKNARAYIMQSNSAWAWTKTFGPLSANTSVSRTCPTQIA